MDQNKSKNSIGLFLLCMVPLAIALILMNAATIPTTFIVMFGRIFKAMEGVEDVNILQERLDIIVANPDLLQTVTTISMTIYNIVAAIGFGLFYCIKIKKKQFNKLSEIYNIKSVLGIILLFIGAESFINLLVVIIRFIFPSMYKNYEALVEQSGIINLSPLMMFVVVILAPIAEEFIFRGITLKLANDFTSEFWIANIIQAAMFGIYHMNLMQGIYTFIMGLCLGYIFKKFNSLTASILAHLTFNIAGTYFEQLFFVNTEVWMRLIYGVTVCFLGLLLIYNNKQNAKVNN